VHRLTEDRENRNLPSSKIENFAKVAGCGTRVEESARLDSGPKYRFLWSSASAALSYAAKDSHPGGFSVSAANVRSGPAWRASAREQQRQAEVTTHKPRKLYIGPLVIIVFFVIEMLIGTRILFQATSQNPNWWPFALDLKLTDVLVSPFRDIQAEPEVKQTGVVEFAALVAFEAYLIAALALLFLIQVVHILAWFVRRGRRGRTPALAVVETAPHLAEESQAKAA
jgi:hypothetical protein